MTEDQVHTSEHIHTARQTDIQSHCLLDCWTESERFGTKQMEKSRTAVDGECGGIVNHREMSSEIIPIKKERKLDKTRRAVVDGYASACCDLDL